MSSVPAWLSASVPAVSAATHVSIGDDRHAECHAYIAAHPRASSSHRPEWLGILSRAFGHESKYLVAESNGRVAGVLPIVCLQSRLFGRFTVSMPFLNYGGVLADSPDAERALLHRAIEETRRIRGSHLELRHASRLFSELPARHHKVAMILPLESSPESQWQCLDRKLRNQIRKAEKSDLTWEAGGLELLSAFYTVFAHNMRDLGTPVYGLRFFTEVLSTLADVTRVFVVRYLGRPVAGAIVHWHAATIEVPWASSIRHYNPLCANVLLYWRMLQFAVERGFRRFDFGRSTPDGGTFHFKRQWGAQPHQLVWEYWTADGRALPNLSPANPRFGLAIKAWQRLPLHVATRLGPLISRNLP
jgi:serine/alanine adding enzyme